MAGLEGGIEEEREGVISAQQERAVAALLSAPTIAKAAAAAEVGERTLYRWLTEPAFRSAYAEARREHLRQATARLQLAAGAAVATLRRIMKDKDAPHAARVTAARVIVEMAYRSHEQEDLSERIAALEQLAVRGR